jgi:hypothetical protein
MSIPLLDSFVPSSGGATGVITATVSGDTVNLTAITPPSLDLWSPLTYSWRRGLTQNFTFSTSTEISTNPPPISDSGLANGSYYYRLILTDQASKKYYTSEVFATIGTVLQPTISSFFPDYGITGDSFVITGTNFSAITSVKIGTTNVTSFIVNSSTQITAITPSTATGVISVTNTAGTATSLNIFYRGIFASDFSSLTPTDKFGHAINLTGATLDTINFDTAPASLNFSAGQVNFTLGASDFLTTDFEIRAWIRLTTIIGSDSEIFCIRQNPTQSVSNVDILLEIDNSNLSVRFRIVNNTAGVIVNVDFNSANNVISLNTPYFLIAKVVGSTATVLLNGAQISTATLTGVRAQTLTTAMIGALYNTGTSDRFFGGQIDSVRVLKP